MKKCLTIGLLLCTAIAHGSETPAFDVHDWPVWAQTQWGHASHHLPQTISVSVINRSPLETDNTQMINTHSLDDVESAGVPTRAFELWFNHQLHEMGVFELSAPLNARFQLEIIILEYQPIFTASGPPGFWRDTKSSFVRWYQDWQEPGLATRLSLTARLTDTLTGATTSFSTFIQAPQCQRLNVAASFPSTVQSPFFEQWSRSLIGQTSIASMNRLLHWLMQFPFALERQYQVSKVFGSRLEFNTIGAPFKLGDEFLIHHKDDHRELGKAKIVRQRGDTFVAYPITMHPAAVTQGDYVRVYKQMPELIQYPAQLVQSNQCSAPMMASSLALNQSNKSTEEAISPNTDPTARDVPQDLSESKDNAGMNSTSQTPPTAQGESDSQAKPATSHPVKSPNESKPDVQPLSEIKELINTSALERRD